jgi:hypothetical protein
MKDIMFDLETMGSSYGSVITQIGACYFDRYSGEIGDKFSVNIDMYDSVREGFKIEPQSVVFWLFQPGRSFFQEPLVPTRQALSEFHGFCKQAKCLWSHSTFDFSMVQYAYHHLSLKSLGHSKTKDIRTLMELADTHKLDDTPNPENAHDALSDAMYQVGYCVKAFNILRKT